MPGKKGEHILVIEDDAEDAKKHLIFFAFVLSSSVFFNQESAQGLDIFFNNLDTETGYKNI